MDYFQNFLIYTGFVAFLILLGFIVTRINGRRDYFKRYSVYIIISLIIFSLTNISIYLVEYYIGLLPPLLPFVIVAVIIMLAMFYLAEIFIFKRNPNAKEIISETINVILLVVIIFLVGIGLLFLF